VLETTRMGIEVQNLRMKVESLSSRLDFSERRVRALEGVVPVPARRRARIRSPRRRTITRRAAGVRPVRSKGSSRRRRGQPGPG
jgi:hypothetical protein